MKAPKMTHCSQCRSQNKVWKLMDCQKIRYYKFCDNSDQATRKLWISEFLAENIASIIFTPFCLPPTECPVACVWCGFWCSTYCNIWFSMCFWFRIRWKSLACWNNCEGLFIGEELGPMPLTPCPPYINSLSKGRFCWAKFDCWISCGWWYCP